MNRIKIGPLAQLSSLDIPQERRSIERSQCFESSGLEYSFFIPMHYQPKHAYPLVVWMHSEKQDQEQLLKVMPQVSTQNFVGLAVRGTDFGNAQGFNWLQSPDSIESACQGVQSAIELACRRFTIHRDRVFIAGLDNGGTMAFRLAFSHPERFAGVASFGGSLPANLAPLSNWRNSRDLPVFWTQGRNSTRFPEANLCRQLRLLHIAGFDVTLRQYPAANETPSNAYADFNCWVMEQISKTGTANIIC